ncbi:MAG: PorV/PorQ family protein, partial [Ignavibacteriae bacterium]|nr:PorV/PorQ family protein [Ignavibacteriota bacterium]
MNKKILLIISLLMFVSQISFGQTKLAQTGLKFLSVGADARASALGEAITSLEGNSSSMFYNPSAMARQESFFDVTFSNTKWIADINYLHASLSIAPENGNYGVFGISIASVDYGTFNETARIPGASEGYLDLGTYSPTAIAIGLGYAKALSEKFAVGGDVRYVYQNLGSGHAVGTTSTDGEYKLQSFDINVVAFDFGILYHTGFKSLDFGMSLRNFSQEIEYVEESFQLPLTFKLGVSMNLFDFINVDKNEHSFLFSVDADHPRDYKEQIHIGGEYTFLNLVSLRLGYTTPTDEQGINAGVGLKHSIGGINFGVDYAYLDFGVFQNVHRF